jgi:hypothetical protein
MLKDYWTIQERLDEKVGIKLKKKVGGFQWIRHFLVVGRWGTEKQPASPHGSNSSREGDRQS